MPITQGDARRIVMLMAAKDQIIEWWDDTIARTDDPKRSAEKYPFVCFADVNVCNAGDNERDGWQGSFVLPREVFGEMVSHAKEFIAAELLKLGVGE